MHKTVLIKNLLINKEEIMNEGNELKIENI